MMNMMKIMTTMMIMTVIIYIIIIVTIVVIFIIIRNISVDDAVVIVEMVTVIVVVVVVLLLLLLLLSLSLSFFSLIPIFPDRLQQVKQHKIHKKTVGSAAGLLVPQLNSSTAGSGRERCQVCDVSSSISPYHIALHSA